MQWSTYMSSKKIGELNGPWAFLFKLSNILLPMVVAWCVWATSQIYALEIRLARSEQWMAQGPRFTSVDADRLRLQILTEVSEQADFNHAQVLNELKSVRSEFVDLKMMLIAHMSSEDKRVQ